MRSEVVNRNDMIDSLLLLLKKHGIIKKSDTGEMIIRVERGGISWVRTKYEETYKRVT